MENSQEKFRHLVYCPFTGLGLYGGFRGNRWLRNRIEIFKHFTVPSLLAQTQKDFTIWVSWRREEKSHPEVKKLKDFLIALFGRERVVFTYHGCCFWDDKYDELKARDRLMSALHGSLADLVNYIGDVDDVIMTIQPSDDCYDSLYVEMVQNAFRNLPDTNLITTKHGYICNYQTLEVKDYEPKTNPPFFSIRFKKDVFIDPFQHAQWTGPYQSHEYVVDLVKEKHELEGRMFLVGTHGENISTHFNHPYGHNTLASSRGILTNFGLGDAEPLKIRYSVRKQLMRKLPHGWQRKLRYIFGERGAARVYNWLRN